MKRSFKLFPILMVSLIIAYRFLWEEPRTEKLAKTNYYILHNAEINGRLKYIDRHGTSMYSFAIEGDTNYYYGLFTYLGTDGIKEFKFFAKEGDSIIKGRYSDTFILIKNNKKYFYRYAKPHR